MAATTTNKSWSGRIPPLGNLIISVEALEAYAAEAKAYTQMPKDFLDWRTQKRRLDKNGCYY